MPMADTEAEVEQRKVRKRDENGNLIEAGYWWFEPRPLMAYWTDALTVFLWFAFGLSILFALLLSQPGLFLVTLACAGGLVARFAASGHWLQRYREVLFCADGRIYVAPNLQPFEDRRLVLSGERHDNIVSIESEAFPAVAAGKVHAVKMHFRSGVFNTVTMDQAYEHHARIIAVQLTLALQELREAGRVSTRARSPVSANPITPTERARRVIE
jgi:hypothetical protein